MFIDSGCILLQHNDCPTDEGTYKMSEPEAQGEDATGSVGSPMEIPMSSDDPEKRAETTGADLEGRNTTDDHSALVSIDESLGAFYLIGAGVVSGRKGNTRSRRTRRCDRTLKPLVKYANFLL